jgi:hypothetical protein
MRAAGAGPLARLTADWRRVWPLAAGALSVALLLEEAFRVPLGIDVGVAELAAACGASEPGTADDGGGGARALLAAAA